MCSSVTVGTGKKVLKTFYKVGYFREIGVFLSLLLRHDTSRSLDDNYKVGGHYNKVKTTTAVDFFFVKRLSCFHIRKTLYNCSIAEKMAFSQVRKRETFANLFFAMDP